LSFALPLRAAYTPLRDEIRASLTRDFTTDGSCWRALADDSAQDQRELLFGDAMAAQVSACDVEINALPYDFLVEDFF
jgi:hypothetical protein